MAFITGKHVPRRTILRGLGARDGVAISRRDGARAGAVVRDGRRCAAWPHPARLHRDGARFAPARASGAPPSISGHRPQTGTGFDLSPTSLSPLEPFRKHLTIVSNTDVRARRSVDAARNRRRPLPVERGVPDAGASEADRKLRRARRDFAGSALREPVRPGHADSLDAAVHRERGPGRWLRLRLLMRLHRHDQLGVADRAAADDPRSRAWRSTSCSAPADRRPNARRGGGRPSSVLDYITGQVADLNRRLDPSDRQRAWSGTSRTCAKSSAASRRSKRAT